MRPLVVVVDDEPIVLRSCRRVLEAAGWRVLEAGSVEGALAVVATETPRLMLIDMKMPGEDGVRLMRRLRDAGRCIPVILMSGYSTEETIREAEGMGALAFLGKPFTPDELSAVIGAAMNRFEKEGHHGEGQDPGHR